jgi:hypothetical protein
MRSEKQIQASRANGARSRGPVTAQGKRNSSRNNLRHGFCIHDPSLDHNPPAAFLTLKAQYTADFQPATAQEIYLVHAMAVARWRTFLVKEAEKRALDKALVLQKANSAGPIPPMIPMMRGVFAFEDVPECRPLLRYQVAFQLQFQRALRRLMALAHSRSQRKGCRDTLTAVGNPVAAPVLRWGTGERKGCRDTLTAVRNLSRHPFCAGLLESRESKKMPSQSEPNKSLNLKGPLRNQSPPFGFNRPLILGHVGFPPRQLVPQPSQIPTSKRSETLSRHPFCARLQKSQKLLRELKKIPSQSEPNKSLNLKGPLWNQSPQLGLN